MPTYVVRREKPVIVCLSIEADNPSDTTAYGVERQPFPPDDTGDERSEARYEHSAEDLESERRERERMEP